jgi:hypothetical protein
VRFFSSGIFPIGSLIMGGFLATGCGDNAPSAIETAATTPFDLPKVISLGGPVLSEPRAQPIYLPGHPFVAEIDDFLARLSASWFWPATAGEYGIGGLTVLPSHISSLPGPATIVSTDVAAFFAQVMAADAAELGPPSPDIMYLLLLPASTAITSTGQALCQPTTPSGYHTEATVDGITVALIVVPLCTSYPGDSALNGVAVLTPTISHELLEAATDPFPSSAPAYLTTDQAHAMWAVAVNGGEVADLCENETPNLVTPDDIGQPVQRSWSNAAVDAGTGPCVPAPPGEIYFAAVPTLPDQVSVQRAGKSFLVPALRARVGASATVSVHLLSEGDQPTSWTVDALEFHAGAAPPTTAVHPVVGLNRQTLGLRVVANAGDAGVFPLILRSVSADASHFWIGTVWRQP